MEISAFEKNAGIRFVGNKRDEISWSSKNNNFNLEYIEMRKNLADWQHASLNN